MHGVSMKMAYTTARAGASENEASAHWGAAGFYSTTYCTGTCTCAGPVPGLVLVNGNW